MGLFTRRLRLAILGVAVTVAGTTPVVAGPWMDSGDHELRHHIQVLADAGVIKVPITTWPLMWSGVARDMEQADPARLSASQRWSLSYVKFMYRRDSHQGTSLSLRSRVSNDPNPFTDFSEKQREDNESTLTVGWLGARMAGQLSATYVDNPLDDKSLRYDGSYLAAVVGNWAITAGAIDRWWGPGWQNSLILSHNARPVPGISLQRNYSTAFETPWLSWIGPWQLTAFIGQLESSRTIEEAKLLGMRVSLRPLQRLELGLSRTAQWGGKGRPEDLTSFTKLVMGKDNRGDDVSVEEEPGNQLAGVDFRWSLPYLPWPSALYGQFIGEDEAGGAPSRFISQIGLETSFLYENTQHRFFLEVIDTAADHLNDDPIFNYAYEHFIYKSGYRFRGRSLGATVDSDSQQLSIGGQHYLSSNSNVNWAVDHMRINYDNSGAHPLVNSTNSREVTIDRFKVGYSHAFKHLRLGVTLETFSEDLFLSSHDEAIKNNVLVDAEYRF